MEYKLVRGHGIAELGDLATQIFKVAVIVAITLVVLVSFSGQLTAGSAARNATDDLTDQVIALVPWVGIFVVVIIGVVFYRYTNLFGGGKKR
jgi:hypothetical protein